MATKAYNYFKIFNFDQKNIWYFFVTFCFSKLWKISPPGQGEVRQGSRRNASGVKEKCFRGQEEVRPVSRKIVSGVKEKSLGLIPHKLRFILPCTSDCQPTFLKKSNASTNITQNFHFKGPWLKISLILLIDTVQMSPSVQV